MSCEEEEEDPVTFCDLYPEGSLTPNYWWGRGDPTARGVCLLDTVTRDQVIYALERVPQAAADLLAITSNEELRDLANTVVRLGTELPMDDMQKNLNRESAKSNPFYSLMRGKVSE